MNLTMNHPTKFHPRRGRAALCLALTLLLPAVAPAQETAPATTADRLNEPGPESARIAQRTGLWDVTETTWGAPGVPPVVTTGLVAERRMVGNLLHETIRPPGDAAGQDVKRVDFLTFNRVEGRWDYASFDTRAAVGLMPAWSSGPEEDGRIVLTFHPFAAPGPEGLGRLLRMEQVITFQGPDRDVKDQYFTVADGTGARRLLHRYAYVRRPPTDQAADLPVPPTSLRGVGGETAGDGQRVAEAAQPSTSTGGSCACVDPVARNTDRESMKSNVTTYNHGAGSADANGLISQGYRVNGTIYVSGQFSHDMQGAAVGEGDFAAQARQTLENLDRVLAGFNVTKSNLAEMVVYLTNPTEQSGLLAPLLADYLGEHRPAGTVIGVTGLWYPHQLIEIRAVAHAD